MAKLKSPVWLGSTLGILESVGGLVLSLFFQVQGHRERDFSWETLPLPACCSLCRAPFNTAFLKKDAPGSSPGIKEAKARDMPGTVLEKLVCLP